MVIVISPPISARPATPRTRPSSARHTHVAEPPDNRERFYSVSAARAKTRIGHALDTGQNLARFRRLNGALEWANQGIETMQAETGITGELLMKALQERRRLQNLLNAEGLNNSAPKIQKSNIKTKSSNVTKKPPPDQHQDSQQATGLDCTDELPSQAGSQNQAEEKANADLSIETGGMNIQNSMSDEMAAVKIQSRVRGTQARKKVAPLQPESDFQQQAVEKANVDLNDEAADMKIQNSMSDDMAAVKIQSRVRGKQARNRVASLLPETLND